MELLERLDESHSLSEAARMMSMSYMKAWLLVQVMNRSFKKPLVQLERGGARGGGAALTPTGREVVELYREMNRSSLEALKPSWQKLRRLLKS